MLTLLIAAALAEPPRAEVLAGWSASASTDYGYATVQPAVLRTERTSLMLRGTVSRLRASWSDPAGPGELEAAGLFVGPAVVRGWGDLSLGAGLSVGGRRSTVRAGEQVVDAGVALDATLTGDAFWRPGQRAQLYAQVALGAAAGSVWVRAGATHPVTPRDAVASLWLGLEGTSSGTADGLVTELGPVAELPVRPLHGSLCVRASTPASDLARGALLTERTSAGLAVYWAVR